MELQTAPPPASQQRSHRNFQFDGLIPAITPKIFVGLTFLIFGGACIGNSIIDSPPNGVLLQLFTPPSEKLANVLFSR
ncbi:hypothetical protein [Pseudanabaena sp. PCC 6802]|uniref:hypothetical protein n=1 Tax=Pseudanabaena sp. PCC 6802 TaxID=118173 RepID=UPI00034C4ACD|nr:hypothetical protein [Pseudanabaena sp. PCC 6802]